MEAAGFAGRAGYASERGDEGVRESALPVLERDHGGEDFRLVLCHKRETGLRFEFRAIARRARLMH